MADDDTIYASSEGLHAPVLRIALPAAVRRAMEPPPSPTPTADPEPHADATRRRRARARAVSCPSSRPADRSAWGWALGGILGLGIVVVLARALRPR